MEIQALPDAELSEAAIMSMLYAKVHGSLASQQTYAVGVSFPDISFEVPLGMGGRLRLHGNETDLFGVVEALRLAGVRDHVQCSGVTGAPMTGKHRKYYRVQAKSSPERSLRRNERRARLRGDEIGKVHKQSTPQLLDLPYLQMSSRTTGHRFRLFVNASDPLDAPVPGRFSAYGLSRIATTPWF